MRRIRLTIFLLFFLSGASALIYEILWLRRFALLFGSTAYATSTVLAAFFFGLAAGAYFWGIIGRRIKNLLRMYALLEFGIALSACLFFIFIPVYYSLYPSLFARFGDVRFFFLIIKFLLAMVVIFPPAFFMGGTFPIMTGYLVRESKQLGKEGGLLYFMNTIGGTGCVR